MNGDDNEHERNAAHQLGCEYWGVVLPNTSVNAVVSSVGVVVVVCGCVVDADIGAVLVAASFTLVGFVMEIASCNRGSDLRFSTAASPLNFAVLLEFASLPVVV